MRTLHVTDLDGTLLAPDARVAEQTAERVRRLIESGLSFSYATARSFFSASRATAGCGFRDPVAVYGGALLVDPCTGGILVRRVLDPATAGTVLTSCREHGIPPIVYHLDGDSDLVTWAADEVSPGIAAYLDDRPDDPRLRPVATASGLPAGDVFYVTVIGDEGPVSRLVDDLRETLGSALSLVVQRDLYRPHEWWLEITAPGADKGTAVQQLRELSGADRLVCFGDNLIDLAMFRVADHAVAVANAAAAVREAAHEVTASNAVDGVVTWLELNARG